MENKNRETFVGDIFLVLYMLTMTISFLYTTYDSNERIEKLEFKMDSINTKLDLISENKFTPELLKQEIIKQQIKFPEIVIKQALLESGHFTSYSFKNRNNIFGFHNGKKYLEFENWKDCVKYYKKWQDKLYKKGDYYAFLENLPYSQDSTYITVLKSIKAGI